MFGVKKYSRELTKLVEKKGLTPVFSKQLIKVDNDKNKAYFKDNKTGEIIVESYDFLHVPPLQRGFKSTAEASFCDGAGFVDVNMYTLQSKKYENIFAFGDCNNCTYPKTAAAIFASTYHVAIDPFFLSQNFFTRFYNSAKTQTKSMQICLY